MMQTTETTTGGLSMVTVGDDDVDTYGGVSFGKMQGVVIFMLSIIAFMIWKYSISFLFYQYKLGF